MFLLGAGYFLQFVLQYKKFCYFHFQNPDAVPEMNFGGKITGNSFAGEVNGVKTQGGFFGENAKELSGLFTNEADKSRGVFGAIKQEAAQ